MNIKKIYAIFACTAALYATNSLAAEHDLSTATYSSGYDLPVNELQTFSGGWLGSTNLSCKVRTTGGEGNTVSVLAMKNR
ncbi:MAG: hypothetical protein PSV35_04810, partial [bacterium]|nr:hypothetical protein [bacterium]